MKTSCFALLLATLALPAAADTAIDSHTLRRDIVGKWASVAPEAYDKVYATRQFIITAKRWGVLFKVYADAAATEPLFHLNVGGPYLLGASAVKVPDAIEGIFPADIRMLIADSPAGVQLFADQGCRLRQGQPLPLVQQGCGFVPSLMQNMGEYDLVAIRNGQLFFGDRSGDLSKTRPDKLTPYPLRRLPR